MDIGAAQLAAGQSGRVDRILIKVPGTEVLDPDRFENWQSKLQQALPAGVLLNAQGTQTAANRPMLATAQKPGTGQQIRNQLWEGAIDVVGSSDQSPLRGAGYLEMTGYAGAGKPVVPR